ncbi:hypothetical protein HN799_05385, partial [Candidatus Woesearchaeota archaeon]|nr:hypothetical protein [Candidatus Woesearchaeota archaeon]
MGTPTWTTTAGSLGIISEREYYRLQFNSTDSAGGTNTYSQIAGVLPSGLRLGSTGILEGQPTEVSDDVDFEFAIRATSPTSIVADRTFSLTITGRDAPAITTGSVLGVYRDSQIINITLGADDSDPADTLVWSHVGGTLPLGLSLSSSGVLSGITLPESTYAAETLGYDVVGYQTVPYDQDLDPNTVTYQFTASVTDGVYIDTRVFTFTTQSLYVFTVDTDLITVDHSGPALTADATGRVPIITTTAGSIGTYRHNNYFSYQFTAVHYNLNQLEWIVTSGALPSGLTLNATSGYIYGNFPVLTPTTTTYSFVLQARELSNPTVISTEVSFSIDLYGEIDTTVTWVTAANLSITAGETSTLSIQATNTHDVPFIYTITSGALPPALTLGTTGLITGFAGYDIMSFDAQTTTFDGGTTTFESEFTIVVNAITQSGEISANKTFNIDVLRDSFQPYENLYLRAFPPLNDRTPMNNFLSGNSLFPVQDLYRPEDPNFGMVDDLDMLLMYGLNPESAATYMTALGNNHYSKKLRYGDFKLAKALESDETTVKYEVIYVEIIDKAENELKVSAPLSYTDAVTDNTIEVNSFENLRSRLRTTVGTLDYNALPLWMQSVQDNGSVLGFINAVPLAYIKPGRGDELLYKLNKSELTLRDIDFVADRYVWDQTFSKFYDKDLEAFVSGSQTT